MASMFLLTLTVNYFRVVFIIDKGYSIMPPPQFKITLGDDLRDKLDHACYISMRSVAEEIRQRLEMSFDLEGDETTLDLMYAMLFLAREIELDFGWTWWSNEKARSAFLAAVADQIVSYVIEPTARPSFHSRARREGGMPDDPPEAIGRAIARNYRRAVRPYGFKKEKFDIGQFRELMRKPWGKKKK